MSPQPSVLITGCSDGGIGSALAQAFHSRGFRVFATLRDPNKASSLSNLPDVTIIPLDVTNPSHISSAVKIVEGETGGSLDYLINNAGRNHFMPLLDEDISVAKGIFEINVWGTLAMTQAFAPLLRRARGMLVNVTSISGYLNIPWMGSYAASKRSMEIMSDTLRVELAPFNVKVLSVVRGAVQTNGLTYFDDLELPAESWYKAIERAVWERAHGGGSPKRMSAEQYAEKAVAVIVKGSSSKVWPGPVAGFIWFSSTWFPAWLMDKLFIKGTGVDALLAGHQKP